MADTPSSTATQQQEAARFRSAVSEALLQSIQANINYLLTAVLPLGSVVHSLLTEAQFQAINGVGWVLEDGRSISTSALALLTGITVLPDSRGRFLRGKNNGRSGATGNPDGDVALGTTQDDQFLSHVHGLTNDSSAEQYGGSGRGDGNDGDDYETNPVTLTVQASGGNETRPRNITHNIFVRID